MKTGVRIDLVDDRTVKGSLDDVAFKPEGCEINDGCQTVSCIVDDLTLARVRRVVTRICVCHNIAMERHAT